jgi:hypothetical protein
MISLRAPQDDNAAKEMQVQYLRELFTSLPRRSSTTRLACAQILLGGLQGLRRSGLPADSVEMTRAAYSILRADFESVDLSNIEGIMRSYWKELQDRSLIPALEHFLRRPELTGRSFTNAHAALLSGLLDLDIEAARPYILDEIQRPDSVLAAEVLGRLPEKQLPELGRAPTFPHPITRASEGQPRFRTAASEDAACSPLRFG